jgi:hypothetical protein
MERTMSRTDRQKSAHPRSKNATEIFARLSCGLGRRDEKPNVEVGRDIAQRRDKKAVASLVELLNDKDASSSAIKALYECGYLAPDLLVPHASIFLDTLRSRKNRLVWGAMIGLQCIAKTKPEVIWPHRAKVMDAFRKGSIITREVAVKALAAVTASSPVRRRELSPWLLEALRQARPQDLHGWLTHILPSLSKEYFQEARIIAEVRLGQLSISARKKVEELIQG